jgi:hypothetical protein
MFGRLAWLAVALVCSGCASDSNPALSQASAAYLGGPEPLPGLEPRQPMTPNIKASKVLSAIAFERVTGRDVDPARLVRD